MGIETVLLGAAIAGSVGSIVEQRKAGKSQRRAMEAERRKADIENVRKTRQSIREARLAQASVTNQAALSGGMGSSALAGGVSSLGSQLAGNLSYMSDIATENTSIFSNTVDAARHQSNAAVYGSVGKLAGTIFGDMSGPASKGAKLVDSTQIPMQPGGGY